MNIPQAERLTEDDRSQAATEQWLARHWAEHQRRAAATPPKPAATGCLGCHDPAIRVGYCGDDCREAHQRRLLEGVR